MLNTNQNKKLIDQFAIAYVLFIKELRRLIISFFKLILFNNKHSTYKKILINRDGAFGDSIVALPAISIIRQCYPHSQIDLLSVANKGISLADISLKEKVIDHLYVIKKKERYQILNKLKKNKYDFFVQLPQNIGLYKSIRNMLLVRFLLGIKSAIGWDQGRIKSFMRQQKKFIEIPTETQRFISNLAKEGIIGTIDYPIEKTKPKNKEIKALLDNKNLMAFIISSKIQPKKWPLDYWIKLARLIGKDYSICLIGGKTESKEADYIHSSTNNTRNLCGKLNISELTYVLKYTRLVISLDTGARHLCDATDTKAIILFSTRDITNKWYPNHKGSFIIEKVLPCSFCLKTTCKNNLCMTTITPKEVYDKVKIALFR